jgi:hypothetical protein
MLGFKSYGSRRTPPAATTRYLLVGVHAEALALHDGGLVGDLATLAAAAGLGLVVVGLGEATGASTVGLGLHEQHDQEAAASETSKPQTPSANALASYFLRTHKLRAST